MPSDMAQKPKKISFLFNLFVVVLNRSNKLCSLLSVGRKRKYGEGQNDRDKQYMKMLFTDIFPFILFKYRSKPKNRQFNLIEIAILFRWVWLAV